MDYEPLYDSPLAGLPLHNDTAISDPGYMGHSVKELECPVCKRTFICYSEDHVYTIPNPDPRMRRIKVCSWHCMRQWEKEQDQLDKTPDLPELTLEEQRAFDRLQKCREKVLLYQKKMRTYQSMRCQWLHHQQEAEELLRALLEQRNAGGLLKTLIKQCH